MDSRESELKISQSEIKDLKILNKAYKETYKRKTREYIKLLITKGKSKFELEGRKEAIRVIKWNLKARKELLI